MSENQGRYSITVSPGKQKKRRREVDGFWAIAHDNTALSVIEDTRAFGRTQSLAADSCMSLLREYVASQYVERPYPREVWRGDL
ncbi:hypothetical protein SEA_CECE_287 [Microbacterium phage Cece]|nr:hypothetical protein SEA_CECE_287 [Microbacterium phage Cece]